MSIFWDRKEYNSFKYKIGNKPSIHSKLRMGHSYPCPGSIQHSRNIGEYRGKIIFNNFQNRPYKSYMVYWKSHFNEYNQIK